MEAQDKPVDGMPTPEIIAALLNFTRLSQRIELAASEAPDAIAASLLERLVTLCSVASPVCVRGALQDVQAIWLM